MFKKIVIGSLALVLVVAAGVSAYNTLASPAAVEISADHAQLNNNAVNQSLPSVSEPTGEQANVPAAPIPSETNLAGNGQGNGYRGGAGQKGNNGQASSEQIYSPAAQFGTPDPQNGLTEWVSMQGVVSGYTTGTFTLETPDGEMLAIQLGNQRFVEQLGLALQNGDSITILGYWDTSGALAIGQITLDATGQVYAFRDEMGRPLWRGGGNH